MSKSSARFTAKKSFNGELNINNHPCTTPPKTISSMGRNFTVNMCQPGFSKTATTKEGIFMAEDDYGESYYYRGAADNWVSFAGFYWRIIRINGDGSIRMIYSGTKENHTGDGATIGGSPYYYQVYDKEKYADYKMSYVKYVVDSWYKTNILDKGYDNKVADTGYCNDMTKYDTNNFGSDGRLYYNKAPTLKCPDKASDLLSKSNNKLTFPVGLITFDEASFAGGVRDTRYNNYYYLNTEKTYWTMTPAKWDGSYVYVGVVQYDGLLFSWGVNDFTKGVRPVLSLKPNVLVTSGDGTEASPYVIN